MNGSGPDGAANIPEYVLATIAAYGDSIAQVDATSGEKKTFHDIWLDVHNIGHWLRTEGLGRGNTVGICLENCLDYAPLLLGVLQAGAVAALYSPAATPRELEHLVSLSKPKAILAPNLNDEQKKAVLKSSDIRLLNFKKTNQETELPVELCPAKLESPALLLSSSGSTGLPKAVIIKHSNLLWALSTISDLMMERGKPALGLMPFYHAYGLGLMLMALCQGAPFVVMNKFVLKDFNTTLVQQKISHLHVVPSLLVKLVSDAVPRKTLKSVRAVFTGAGSIATKIQAAVLEKLEPGAKLYHSYGMTETTHIIAFGEARADKPGSPGIILPCMKAKIIANDEKPVAAGEQGELCLQGPLLTCGYYNNPAATEEAFTADRWLKTGDLAWMDSDGYLFIVDRIKDIIKYQGYQISVTELEHVIGEQKGVLEVAVVGVQHEAYGEVPRAYIVPDNKSKPTELQIQQAVSRELSHYKWLRGGIIFVDSLPKTPSMKINRKLLRSMQ